MSMATVGLKPACKRRLREVGALFFLPRLATPMDQLPPQTDSTHFSRHFKGRNRIDLMRLGTAILVLFFLALPACRTVPPATPEERALRDQWAALVPLRDRQQVLDEAARHTDWGEKRKIRYEVERYEHLVREQKHKSKTT